MRLRIATYNTHANVGMDRRVDAARIARVVGELGADIVALQELDTRRGDLLQHLHDTCGYFTLAGPTIHFANGSFGNGLLTRFPIVSATHIPLSVELREPRAAIDAVLDCDGIVLRVIVTHLGLRARERAQQVARLIDVLAARPQACTVLLGDLNEWLLPRRALRRLHELFGEPPARATFPALLPLVALDRIWLQPAQVLQRLHVHSTRLARVASDHVPLIADIELDRDGEYLFNRR